MREWSWRAIPEERLLPCVRLAVSHPLMAEREILTSSNTLYLAAAELKTNLMTLNCSVQALQRIRSGSLRDYWCTVTRQAF